MWDAGEGAIKRRRGDFDVMSREREALAAGGMAAAACGLTLAEVKQNEQKAARAAEEAKARAARAAEEASEMAVQHTLSAH